MAPNLVKCNRQSQIRKRKPEEILDKKKKRKKELVPYLNDDIMWHIFNRVPAISLVENCMFLCKQWYHLICNQNFLKAHFLRSKPGMIFLEKLEKKGKDAQLMKFVEFKGTEITDVHRLHIFKKDVNVLSYCGGLFLMRDDSCSKTLVINPITKESIRLPRLFDLWRELVFDQASMDYRLVVLSDKRGYVLTLFGLDGSCKRIKTPNWLGDTVLINGVLYCDAEGKGICCLDLSTEIFSHFNWPINVDDTMVFHKILDAGGSLCFVAFYAEKGSNEDLFLFAMPDNTLNAYDVKTKQWRMIKPSDNNHCYGIHVSSILPLIKI